jgi:hypothetical protein
VWYTFKPDSPLSQYLKTHHIYLTEYFCPQDLIDAVKKILYLGDHNIHKNSKIITLDPELQELFNQWIIFEPHLMDHLLPHVDKVSSDMSIKLQNQHVFRQLFINPPFELIYQNPSSRFWLHPSLNYVLTKNKRLTYPWKPLLSVFTDLCTTNNKYFSHKDEMFIIVNPNSSIASLFPFNCFHVSQCESILKQLTKYIGNTTLLAELCPNLKTEYIFYDFLYNEKSLYKDTLMFIEDSMNATMPLFAHLSL